MTREEKINEALNKHFKSNNGAWFVVADSDDKFVYLRCDYTVSKVPNIKFVNIVLYILRNFKDVEYVLDRTGGWVYTRSSLRRAGYKI